MLLELQGEFFACFPLRLRRVNVVPHLHLCDNIHTSFIFSLIFITGTIEFKYFFFGFNCTSKESLINVKNRASQANQLNSSKI